MAVDFHQHLWPASFIAALQVRRVPPMLDGDVLITTEGRFPIRSADHEPSARLRAMDQFGIELAVLSLQPSLGFGALPDVERETLECSWIEGIGELVADSTSRFAALAPGRVVPGFVGVSVGAAELVADLDGGSRLLTEANDCEAVVFVHPEAGAAVPPGRPDWWSWLVDYPGQMQAAYLAWLAGGRVRHPRLRIVFGLLAGGAPFQHERLAHRGAELRAVLDPLVYFDTASYGRRAIELCVETFGVENLVFGSDLPVIDAVPTLLAVQGFGVAVTQFVTETNPRRLLQRGRQ